MLPAVRHPSNTLRDRRPAFDGPTGRIYLLKFHCNNQDSVAEIQGSYRESSSLSPQTITLFNEIESVCLPPSACHRLRRSAGPMVQPETQLASIVYTGMLSMVAGVKRFGRGPKKKTHQ